jgi:hypothetical protein
MKDLLALCCLLVVTTATLCARGHDSTFCDGRDVILAMEARYAGQWYPAVRIKQRVAYFEDGAETRNEVWTEMLQIPGRVRSTIGDPDSGNCEIARNDSVFLFRRGNLIESRRAVHGILLLGFDVYRQDPTKTFAQLREAGYDLDLVHESLWKGKPAYVVGAEAGDDSSSQFWIEKERLVLVRLLTKGARTGRRFEVELNDIKPLAGGWIATELRFLNAGLPRIIETYLEFGVPVAVPPRTFDTAPFTVVRF